MRTLCIIFPNVYFHLVIYLVFIIFCSFYYSNVLWRGVRGSWYTSQWQTGHFRNELVYHFLFIRISIKHIYNGEFNNNRDNCKNTMLDYAYCVRIRSHYCVFVHCCESFLTKKKNRSKILKSCFILNEHTVFSAKFMHHA